MSIHVGVDCGRYGGISLINDQLTLLENYRLPWTATKGFNVRDIVNHLKDWDECYNITHVLIEECYATPMMSRKSSFSFGFNVGLLHGVLESILLNCRFDLILPVNWMRKMHQRGDLDDTFDIYDKKTKGRSLQACRMLYPDYVFSEKDNDDGLLDSLLIAHYSLNYHWK